MSTYILRHIYNEIPVKILGSTIDEIKKSIRNDWDELLDPDFSEEEDIKERESFLNKDYKTIREMEDDYHKIFHNDECIFEEAS